MNKSALNRAWVIRWKSATFGSPRLRVNIITATCLSVDKAMIFFISHSAMALALAISIVRVEMINSEGRKLFHESIKGKNRYRR